MSGSLNKVMLIGNLGADPEIRATKTGDKVASFRLATSNRWRDKDGQSQEKTEWHKVVVFGRVADVIERYVHKGSKLLVEGKLQTRKWVDTTSQQERYTTEVVVSGFNANITMLDSRSSSPAQTGPQEEAPSYAPLSVELDDDIPF